MSEVQRSLHYREGLEHLKLDIPTFVEQFDQIKTRVNEFNKEITSFKSSELREILFDEISRLGMGVTEGYSQMTPLSKTLNVDILTDNLKLLFLNDIQFGPDLWQDKTVRINGAVVAIYSEAQEGNQYKETINNLKNLGEIVQKFTMLKEEYEKIIECANGLSNAIGEKIVKYIENGEYDRTCKYCVNHINNPQ